MLQEPIVATLIILALIALGEIVSIATNARIPMLLISLLGYLLLLRTGVISESLIMDSSFVTIGLVLGTAPIIVHMGTLIPIKIIKTQWKAVFISLLGVTIATILIILIVPLIFDYETAVAGTGPLTGGLIAFLVTTEKLVELGFTSLISIPILVLALQGLFTMPLATNLLRKYAIQIREAMDAGTYVAAAIEAGSSNSDADKSKKTNWIPEKYQTNVILLFQLFIGGAIAIILDKLTGVPYSIWALTIGIIGKVIGFYPDRVMERANAFTVGMIGLVFLVISFMNEITFEMIVSSLPEVLTIIILGGIGIIIGGYIGSKWFKWHPYKGIPVALTATFGFPADYIVCEEVSRSVGRNKKEEETIFNEIVSPMLIGGFTTVTVASVIIASILIKTL